MSGSNDRGDPLESDESLDRIVMHAQVVGVLNIAMAAFYFMSAARIGFNLSTSELSSENREFATAIGGILTVISVPYLLTGIGLLLRIKLAKYAAILTGLLHLFELPIGTPLGLYTLWLFMFNDTSPYFRKTSPPKLELYSHDDE